MNSRRKRALIVHTGGIGDFILALPAIVEATAGYQTEFLGYSDRLALAVAGGLGHDAHNMDAIEFHTLFDAPSAKLRSFLARFDRCIVWMRDDGAIEQGMKACGVADYEVFPGLPPPDWRRHASGYYRECLDLLADGHELPSPLLKLESSSSENDVIIHPGSGGRNKNWPLERFQQLADILATQERTVQWSTGPAEDGLRLRSRDTRLGPLSLVELGRELVAARLYIGNDSGVTHLAAAVGCRAVAVFGPSDPAVWAPHGPRVRVVHAPPWPGVTSVLTACDEVGGI